MKKIFLLLATSLVLFACEKEAPEQVADESEGAINIPIRSIPPLGALPGKFTVNAEGKQVYFSKGNLYYDLSTRTYYFEDNQYATPDIHSASLSHLAHFYWSKDANAEISLSKYSNPHTSAAEVFFANHPESFEVEGHTGWSVLTGGTNGEWKYLINYNNRCGQTVRSGKCKYAVKVCGYDNCLILLPDDWKWGENGVGSDWLSEYSDSTTVKWSTMEASGAVCLSAAGFRNGGPDGKNPKNIEQLGSVGYYWASTPYGSDQADFMYFTRSVLVSDFYIYRYYGYSVRLVTEVK